jgi:hypothetical protein
MAELQQRIGALLDQLSGLGAKRTGMPVDADDWNALVDTVRGVLEIAAAQDAAADATAEQRYAQADHAHLAEVTNEWLDAQLRAAVATGAAPSSIGSAVTTTRTDAQLLRLLDETGRLRLVLEDQQARLDRAVVGDLDRTKEVADLRVKVGAVNDLRGVVNGLEDRLRTTNADLATLNRLRDSLTDAAGVPIDIGALKTSVNELSRLRENLTDAQGNLVRMRDVLAKLDERRVNEPGPDLDGRFDDLRSSLNDRLTNEMASAEGRLRASADERAAQLRSDVTAQLDSSLSANRLEVQRSTDARIAAAEQRLNASVTTQVRDATANLRPDLTTLVRTTVRDELSGVDNRISAAVDAARVAVGNSLRAELTDAATAAADARTAAVIDAIRDRVDGLAGRVGGLDDAVAASVTASLDARLNALLDEVDARTATRLDAARQALAQTVADQVNRAVDDRVGDLDGRIRSAVDVSLADVDARIDRRVTARTTGLTDQVRDEVRLQVQNLRLADTLSALETRLTTSLRADMGAMETRLEARRTSSQAELATQLRNENEAGRVGLESRLNRLQQIIANPHILNPPR